MTIKNMLLASLLTTGIVLGTFTPQTAEARHKRKVVYKHKRVHHRHAVGLRHIGKGTKIKTTVKSETKH